MANLKWRWVFWITVPLSVSSLLLIIFFLPLKPVTGSFKKKLRKVDFLGAFTSLIATVFILVPISGGGSSFAWSSPIVVAMLTIGIASFLIFLFVEWKVAPLPIMPLRLFHNRSLFLLAWISFLSGVYFFGNTYFLPIYFQLALDPPAGPLLSSALQQALLLPQISTALSSGFALQKYDLIRFSAYIDWVTIILSYGPDTVSISSAQEFKPPSADPHLMPISPEFSSSKVSVSDGHYKLPSSPHKP